MKINKIDYSIKEIVIYSAIAIFGTALIVGGMLAAMAGNGYINF